MAAALAESDGDDERGYGYERDDGYERDGFVVGDDELEFYSSDEERQQGARRDAVATSRRPRRPRLRRHPAARPTPSTPVGRRLRRHPARAATTAGSDEDDDDDDADRKLDAGRKRGSDDCTDARKRARKGKGDEDDLVIAIMTRSSAAASHDGIDLCFDSNGGIRSIVFWKATNRANRLSSQLSASGPVSTTLKTHRNPKSILSLGGRPAAASPPCRATITQSECSDWSSSECSPARAAGSVAHARVVAHLPCASPTRRSKRDSIQSAVTTPSGSDRSSAESGACGASSWEEETQIPPRESRSSYFTRFAYRG